eukprot:10066932-Lingulodinium_polyedra.AAC.1
MVFHIPQQMHHHVVLGDETFAGAHQVHIPAVGLEALLAGSPWDVPLVLLPDLHDPMKALRGQQKAGAVAAQPPQVFPELILKEQQQSECLSTFAFALRLRAAPQHFDGQVIEAREVLVGVAPGTQLVPRPKRMPEGLHTHLQLFATGLPINARLQKKPNTVGAKDIHHPEMQAVEGIHGQREDGDAKARVEQRVSVPGDALFGAPPQ